MKYDFDAPIERRSQASTKWNKYDPDVLPLWVADMDFASPPAVQAALRRAVEHGIYGYPQEAVPGLRETLVEWVGREYGWQIQEGWLVFLPGVVPGFNLAAQAAGGGSGGELVIQTPVYPPFLRAAANAGMAGRNASFVSGETGYEVDWESFSGAFSPQTRMFLLCNPHNPLGRVFRREELERMAEICLRHDALICSDEIHCDLVYGGHKHLPVAALDPEIACRTITLYAPSKTFNIAGLQFAFAVIPDDALRKRYMQAGRGLGSWAGLFGQLGALAAYRKSRAWLAELLVYLQGNRDYLVNFVNEELPGVHMHLPEATYLGWLDFRETPMAQDPYTILLEQARVALNDGKTFGAGGEGFVRLNFGCPRSTLVEALGRIRHLLI